MIPLRPHAARGLARLLDALAFGEQIAHACATAQAPLCADVRLARFLRQQARHEAVHAAVFATAAGVVAERAPANGPLHATLRLYRRQLLAHTSARQLAESLVGLQVVLEGVGGLVLEQLVGGLRARRAAHAALGRRLLAQETAHHAFGVQALRRLVRSGSTERAALQAAADAYLPLALRMLYDSSETLAAFDLSVANQVDRLTARVGHALTAGAA